MFDARITEVGDGLGFYVIKGISKFDKFLYKDLEGNLQFSHPDFSDFRMVYRSRKDAVRALNSYVEANNCDLGLKVDSSFVTSKVAVFTIIPRSFEDTVSANPELLSKKAVDEVLNA